MKLQPTSVPGLVKEEKGVMVINTNYGEYNKILAHRKKNSEDKQFKNDMRKLQQDVQEMLNLLRK